MIKNEIEKAKQALISIYTLEKAEFELMWRESDDPEHPLSFWRMSYYQDKRIVGESNKVNWNLLMACDLDTIEEAVAYPIVKTIKNNHYDTVEVPDKLKKYWKPHKIIVEDRAGLRKGDVRTSTNIEFWIKLTNGEWVLDFEERRNNFAAGLTYVPGQYYWMHEGAVPWELSYMNNENPKDNDIVGFMYKGHYFTQTLFIPDQKCICGESETYLDSYEGDNSIKVEVWSVDKFFKRNEVYILNNKMFFNGNFYQREVPESTFITEEEKSKIKKMFPKAESISDDMEWTQIAK